MFEMIQEQVRTIEGINSMSCQDMYYAFKWQDQLEITKECFSELVNLMAISGM